MARPFKQGLQYFPMDVNIFEDEKLQELNYQYGPMAEHIYIRILTLVYANGYYLEMSVSALSKTLHKRMGPNWIKLEKVSELVVACLEMGLFDKELAAQGVITSVPIQKQFILSTKRRQNVNISKYWLLGPATMENIRAFLSTSDSRVNVNKMGVNVDNNSINVNSGTQKEKEKKIDKLDKYIDKRTLDKPNMHFLTKCLIEDGYISSYTFDYYKYDVLFIELVKSYDFDLVRAVTQYISRYTKRSPNVIDDRFDYFKTSAINNLEMLSKRKDRSNESIEETIKRFILSMDQGSARSR